MITITESEADRPDRRRRTIAALTVDQISNGDLQEGQDLDFKRFIEFDKPEAKKGLLDDVVAFLNRGPGRIIVGVEEKGGRFGSFHPMDGNADKTSLRFQTFIQDSISPVPVDVQVVPIHLDGRFLLDIQIPQHIGGPFMSRLSGGYLIRSGARNLPIDPGMLRSRFVDEKAWMSRLDELTAAEDARIAEGDRLVGRQALRIGILPQEHFDYHREPFTQRDRVRFPGPIFHQGSEPWFKVTGDGHELFARDLLQQGIERLYIRDDWFIHAHVAFALLQTSGERRLQIFEFDAAVKVYLGALAAFLTEQNIAGPFAITFALQGLVEGEHFGNWFPDTAVVRTLRPRIVQDVDDPELIADFLRRVRQASRYG